MVKAGEADVVEHGARSAVAAPTVPGPGADGGAGATEALTPSAMSAGLARRIRRARRFCLWTMAFFALLVPFFGCLGVLMDLAFAISVLDRQPAYVLVLAVVRCLALIAASILCGLALARMVRERMDGRQIPDQRLYRVASALFLVLCLFLWYTPHVFSICAIVWVLATFLAPRRQLLWVTLVLLALPWLSALISPMRSPLLPAWGDGVHDPLFVPNMVGNAAIMFFWALILWTSCLYTVWLWDAIRQVTDGQQARAQLAVDGERLRFTNDMRELLGHRLDALRLGAGRAGGLVRDDPEAARAEIDQVHELARTTLRQVRSVVRGYRDIDLGAEVSAVRAVLEANGTATSVTGLAGFDPPAETAALAAWVVREGGTNVLRHSRAHRCRISFSVAVDPGTERRELVVEVANDRAREGERGGTESSSGLAGLAERISGGGGTLAAARTDDGGFLLRAALPLPGGPYPPGDRVNESGSAPLAVSGPSGGGAPVPDVPAAIPEPPPEEVPGAAGDPGLAADLTGDRRVRIARRIIMGLIGFTGLILALLALTDTFYSADLGMPLWRSAVGTALAVVVAVLLVRLLRERMDGNREPSPRLLWASVALLLSSAVFLNTPVAALMMIGSWWGTGILFTSRRSGTLISALLLLAPLPLLPTFHIQDPVEFSPLAYGLLWLSAVFVALLFVFSTFGTIWLWDISREAVAGQRARAQLAVTQERLRFARDMHDLLGHSLSALAVKSQLAGRLVERAPDRAVAEIAEVQALARQALQQVRSAVSGYREVDLEGEVEAITAVLDSGGTRTVVTGLDGLELPPKVAALAAWVVREGGTNVMRHSDADECQISFTLTRQGGERRRQLVVEVHNDGAREERPGGGSDGNGLAGLAERVAMSDGTLSRARTKDGGFLLRAIIPL
ncbi:sensor histidine kinase [Nocardiopsis metallicus]|uniref:Two-component system sensor histidine kinase DesK n=1 Tax=Nocardiopsis metallicus TaxID=179819 RepID=A0A840WDK3_9ACTN|nr:histidine kinase [Nocardiopsis metallicus]MBB5493493.1 two-component system sensor histidine kinase DesK [Nocardiopsis metallicus]